MRDQEILDMMEAYNGIYEGVGVPIPPGESAASYLEKILPRGEKVIKPKDDKPVPSSPVRQAEEYSVYDQVLDYLLDEGYAENKKAAEIIMLNMSEAWRCSILKEDLASQISALTNKGGFQRYASTTGKPMYPFPKLDPPTGTQGPSSRLSPDYFNRPTPQRLSPGQLELDLSPRTPTPTPPSTSRLNPYRPGATVRGTGPGFEPQTGSSSRFNPRGVNPRSVINPDTLETIGNVLNAASVLARPTPLGAAALVMTPTRLSAGTLDAAPTRTPKGEPITSGPMTGRRGQTYWDTSTRNAAGASAHRQVVGSELPKPNGNRFASGNVNTPNGVKYWDAKTQTYNAARAGLPVYSSTAPRRK